MAEIDLEDQALRVALAPYTPGQIRRALDLIATGKIKARPPRAWLMPSATQPRVSYLVIDDGPFGLWCPCPACGRCYHEAVAIMLRVHAKHAEPGCQCDGDGGYCAVHNNSTATNWPLGTAPRRVTQATPSTSPGGWALPDPFAGMPVSDDRPF